MGMSEMLMVITQYLLFLLYLVGAFVVGRKVAYPMLKSFGGYADDTVHQARVGEVVFCAVFGFLIAFFTMPLLLAAVGVHKLLDHPGLKLNAGIAYPPAAKEGAAVASRLQLQGRIADLELEAGLTAPYSEVDYPEEVRKREILRRLKRIQDAVVNNVGTQGRW